MLILLAIAGCSHSSMTLNLAHVGPTSTKTSRVELGPSTAKLVHSQELEFLFSGQSSDMERSDDIGVLPITLSNRLIEIGPTHFKVPVPDASFQAPLSFTTENSIITEAKVTDAFELVLPFESQRLWRSLCKTDNQGKSELQFTASWATNGFEDGAKSMTVNPGSGDISPLMEPQPVDVTCALPEREKTNPMVPILRATRTTQARLIGSFQGPHFDVGGDLIAGSYREAMVLDSARAWELIGSQRTDCDQVFGEVEGHELRGSSTLLVGGSHPLQPRKVTPLDADVQAQDGIPYTNAWSVDLDGDGNEEMVSVSEADLPDFNEPSDIRYALVSVRSGETEDSVGFPTTDTPGIKLNHSGKQPRFVQLDAIADVTGDGRMEIIISNHQPWLHLHEQVVYAWSPAGFWSLANDIQGEEYCYVEGERAQR